MKYFKIIGVFFAVSIAMNACNDDGFLEKLPTDEIVVQSLFKTADGLNTYMNQFYDRDIFPFRFGRPGQSPGSAHLDLGSDNLINLNLENTSIVRGIRTVPTSGGGWGFGQVREINFFFDNYKVCEDDFELWKQYLGEAYFFRAWIYYHLWVRFGAVPWFNTVVETDNNNQLYGKRTPRNIVADNMIRDLDSAAMYLPGNTGNGTRVNKWLALLLQSRIALYEGTWEKYHSGDPFGVSDSDPEKYFNKAVEAVTQMLNSGELGIYNTGHPETDYYDLFNLRSYNDVKEVLLWKEFSLGAGIVNYRNYRLELPRGYSITKSLADAYLCIDGKPISVSTLFQGHNNLTVEAENRDPRFYQTIFLPGQPWQITDAGDTTYWNAVYNKLNESPADNYAPAGYVMRKRYNPHMQYHDVTSETNPVILFRYAEALLNYAEAKAELGNITQSDLDRSVNVLRDRVGMAHLVKGSIAIDPDWKFPDLSPMINEIRRERRVELALEDLRWNDITRWAAAEELIVGKRPKGFKGSQISSTLIPVDKDGFLDPFKNVLPSGYGFRVNRDYLWPIPEHELVLNPDLEQNPGW